MSEPQKASGFPPKQLAAIARLASGESIRATAIALKIHEDTIDRWLTLPDFRKAVRQASEAVYDAFLLKAVSNMGKVQSRLMAIIDDPDSRPSDICSCARLLIDSAHRFKESQVEQRLADLEAVVEELSG